MFSNTSQSTINNVFPRYHTARIRSNRNNHKIREAIYTILVISAFMIISVWIIGRGLDTHIQNQDRMMCESARVSGNTEYLNKCGCYYKGNDIACMEGGEK